MLPARSLFLSFSWGTLHAAASAERDCHCCERRLPARVCQGRARDGCASARRSWGCFLRDLRRETASPRMATVEACFTIVGPARLQPLHAAAGHTVRCAALRCAVLHCGGEKWASCLLICPVQPSPAWPAATTTTTTTNTKTACLRACLLVLQSCDGSSRPMGAASDHLATHRLWLWLSGAQIHGSLTLHSMQSFVAEQKKASLHIDRGWTRDRCAALLHLQVYSTPYARISCCVGTRRGKSRIVSLARSSSTA